MERVCEVCGKAEYGLCHHVLTNRGWVIAFDKQGDHYNDVRVRCEQCVTVLFLMEVEPDELHTRYKRLLGQDC